MPRAVVGGLMILYCLGIWLALDFTYSGLTWSENPRVAHPVFHHTLAANFEGYDEWGDFRHKLTTNNLGFKDAVVRDVPLTPSTRRIVLIGDSFTEGVGMAFADSFAGMLHGAGQASAAKIELLNAGVSGYSPTLYYQKIKHLLDKGLRFDELVVLPDMSDVADEAARYFCIDDDPTYRGFCETDDPEPATRKTRGDELAEHFRMTDLIRGRTKDALLNWKYGTKDRSLDYSYLDGWALSGWQGAPQLQPLGIEGGIVRSLKRMQELADLLKARGIPLVVAVFPRPPQIAHNDHSNRQIDMYRDFCARNCRLFINLFPFFFDAARAHPDWHARYFISRDYHFSAEGNRLMFQGLAKYLL
jgi:lysophospholipase L1-like esterase